jgi:HPr kinase/phosphorylase
VTDDNHLLVHASCVAIGDRGILILGPPKSGKSDLVLRLIDNPGYGLGDACLRAELVSDDQTLVIRRADTLFASAPQTIVGKLEVRGIGILSVPYRREAALVLAVTLLPAAEIERLPDERQLRYALGGLDLAHVSVDPIAASAPARVRAALFTTAVG